MQNSALRVILIGGPSNVGKSTLAQSVAARLGWHSIATDTLARHPGRPWGHVRPHVVEHYLTLSPDELFAAVVRHYRSMWPNICDIIAAHASDPAAECLVMEGSAIWPESVATLQRADVGAIWLRASDAFLRERITRASGFDHATAQEQTMIEKFLGRTYRYNARMMDLVQQFHLPWIDIEASSSLEELTDACLQRLGMNV